MPSAIESGPGRSTPTPSAPAAWSPAPAATGTPSGVAPGDLGRLEQPRQPGAVELERVEHLVAPAPPRDVEQQRARRVGHVDRVLAAQPQPHVVLRQHDPRDPRVVLRLVAAQPQQLRRGEAGQRAVAGAARSAGRGRPAPRSRRTRPRCGRRSRGSPGGSRGRRRRARRARASARSARCRPARRRRAPRAPARSRATSPRGPARPSRAAGSTAGRRPRAREDRAVLADGERLHRGGPDVEADQRAHPRERLFRLPAQFAIRSRHDHRRRRAHAAARSTASRSGSGPWATPAATPSAVPPASRSTPSTRSASWPSSAPGASPCTTRTSSPTARRPPSATASSRASRPRSRRPGSASAWRRPTSSPSPLQGRRVHVQRPRRAPRGDRQGDALDRPRRRAGRRGLRVLGRPRGHRGAASPRIRATRSTATARRSTCSPTTPSARATTCASRWSRSRTSRAATRSCRRSGTRCTSSPRSTGPTWSASTRRSRTRRWRGCPSYHAVGQALWAGQAVPHRPQRAAHRPLRPGLPLRRRGPQGGVPARAAARARRLRRAAPLRRARVPQRGRRGRVGLRARLHAHVPRAGREGAPLRLAARGAGGARRVLDAGARPRRRPTAPARPTRSRPRPTGSTSSPRAGTPTRRSTSSSSRSCSGFASAGRELGHEAGIGEHAAQRQRRGAAHGGLGAQLRGHDPRRVPLGGEHARVELLLQPGQQPRRERREVAADDDAARVEQVGGRRDADAEPVPGLVERRAARARRPRPRARPARRPARRGRGPQRAAARRARPASPGSRGCRTRRRSPSGSTVVCPSSPPNPCAPRNSSPPTMIPAPIAQLARDVEEVAELAARRPPTARRARRGSPRSPPGSGTPGRRAARPAARRPTTPRPAEVGRHQQAAVAVDEARERDHRAGRQQVLLAHRRERVARRAGRGRSITSSTGRPRLSTRDRARGGARRR